MRKIILNILFVSLVIDAVGLSPRALAWWYKGPRERVLVAPRERIIVPGAVAVVPAVIVPSPRRVYCKNNIPPYVALGERAHWVERCARFEARPM